MFINFLFTIGIMYIVFVLYNIYRNEFGLFGNFKEKEYRVYRNERTSKYLFSYNYVPNNFDGILIGPSLSTIEMNTKNIKNNKIYNLSVNGANISELKYLIDNVFKYGDIKKFIICLDPYLFQDSGLKTASINKKEYYASFLSPRFIYNYYLKKKERLVDPKNDIYQNSYWGYRFNDPKDIKISSTYSINNVLADIGEEKFKSIIDDKAYLEVTEIFEDVRKRNIKVIAYFFPRPKRIFERYYDKASYLLYKEKIDKLLDYDKDIIIDLNQKEFDYFRNNDENYADVAHLSKKGGEEMISILNNRLNA